MIKFSVTQNGRKLAKSKYKWDEKTLTFSSAEDNLVLDFNGIDSVTFKTGNKCTIKVGNYCTFDTGSYCTFDTKNKCTFNTASYCKFNTGSWCAFNTSGS